MIIDCYLSAGCASQEALRKNIEISLALEKVEGSLNIFRIDDLRAEELGLSGSPSIFINGNELQPQNGLGFT
jgi:hypothetical protein